MRPETLRVQWGHHNTITSRKERFRSHGYYTKPCLSKVLFKAPPPVRGKFCQAAKVSLPALSSPVHIKNLLIIRPRANGPKRPVCGKASSRIQPPVGSLDSCGCSIRFFVHAILSWVIPCFIFSNNVPLSAFDLFFSS